MGDDHSIAVTRAGTQQYWAPEVMTSVFGSTARQQQQLALQQQQAAREADGGAAGAANAAPGGNLNASDAKSGLVGYSFPVDIWRYAARFYGLM